MLTQDRLFSQVRTAKVWDELTLQAEIGDYFHLPYTPIMEVVEKETISNGRVWLQVKPRSGSYLEEWILQPETLEQHSQQQQLSQVDETEAAQPVALTLDSLSCELQPTQIADIEFEQGRCHGQLDAAERGHPIYSKASCSYSTGYLEGYKNTLNPPQQKPQPKANKQKEWSVTYNSTWEWYIVWVGDCPVGTAANASEGEQIAQSYIANSIASNKFWQEHRERVLAAYAG